MQGSRKGEAWDMENFAISVIMPCFNAQEYIGETMESLFGQTFQDFEVICIDDGSTDGTLAILEELANGHPNMAVVSEENHRQGYARNQGIARAKGTYIYYMDSDDLLDASCFQVIYGKCEKEGLDLLFFEADSFYESEELERRFPEYKKLYHRKRQYPGIYTGEEMYVQLRKSGDMIVSPCLQIVRREFLGETGIRFPELPLMEDNLYLFQCLLAAKRVAVISERLYLRRVRSASTMTDARQKERQYALGVTLCEILKFAAGCRQKEELYQTILEHARAMVRHLSGLSMEWEPGKWDALARECGAVPLPEVMELSLLLDDKLLQSRGRLQEAWDEKAEMNRKLQVTYDEKAERGVQIQKLKTQVKKLQEQIKEIQAQGQEENKKWERKWEKKEEELTKHKKALAKARAELEELKSRFFVRVSQKVRKG